MRKNGKAERRNIYQPDRIRTGFRYSDSQTFVQTHFQIGKYYGCMWIHYVLATILQVRQTAKKTAQKKGRTLHRPAHPLLSYVICCLLGVASQTNLAASVGTAHATDGITGTRT
jgi:hypothetical protein